MNGFVVVKAGREYVGGFGYDGPACLVARVTPGKLYRTKDAANIAKWALLNACSEGFQVHEFRPYSGKVRPITPRVLTD